MKKLFNKFTMRRLGNCNIGDKIFHNHTEREITDQYKTHTVITTDGGIEVLSNKTLIRLTRR